MVFEKSYKSFHFLTHSEKKANLAIWVGLVLTLKLRETVSCSLLVYVLQFFSLLKSEEISIFTHLLSNSKMTTFFMLFTYISVEFVLKKTSYYGEYLPVRYYSLAIQCISTGESQLKGSVSLSLVSLRKSQDALAQIQR